MKRLTSPRYVSAFRFRKPITRLKRSEKPSMEHIGIDVHKREREICILTSEGEILEWRIESTRDRFTAALKARPRGRVVLEATTASEWVVHTLEQMGHQVIVVDPNCAPMYPERRRVRTDRRDTHRAEAAHVHRRGHQRVPVVVRRQPEGEAHVLSTEGHLRSRTEFRREPWDALAASRPVDRARKVNRIQFLGRNESGSGPDHRHKAEAGFSTSRA